MNKRNSQTVQITNVENIKKLNQNQAQTHAVKKSNIAVLKCCYC